MGYQQSFAISAAGMDVERMRVEVAAMNLANAHTVAEPGSPAYVPRRVIAHAVPVALPGGPGASFANRVARGLGGLVASVVPTGQAPHQVLEPGHPQADARGFVNYPGIDTATEMFTIMTAVRAYEANVAAMSAARSMALKALEIGGSQ